jgi:hypothetical protein
MFLNMPQVVLSQSYGLIISFMFLCTVLFDIIMQYKSTKCTFLNILIFYILYMFQNWGFIFRKTVVYKGKVQCVLHASV